MDYWESRRAGWNFEAIKGVSSGVGLKSDRMEIFSKMSWRIT